MADKGALDEEGMADEAVKSKVEVATADNVAKVHGVGMAGKNVTPGNAGGARTETQRR